MDRLLVEGGGELNWEFARLDLIDELFVTVAPTLLGGRDAPTLLEGAGFKYEGVAQSYLQIDGRWRNHVLYAALRSDRRGRVE